ncbi:hypothetical protein [Tuwongella immobilis]|uniref:Uncharacterized protein n=1 Tax=Tuwongella immobilis TaxID=692036 RepID=A0A6C2YV22_9BACT|nr:hypothetical protein [Tuwongella immobilis]VIP05460.1 unnamed protein product [Tuwongella immobilis]VTS08276.1 unnamed protein product [Tuwongella immobilis]
MQSLGTTLLVIGIGCVAVGTVGLVSVLLGMLGVSFEFIVRPWYGPFLGGALLAGIGWSVRRQTPPSNPAV